MKLFPRHIPQVLYPDSYILLVFLSTMDVIMTTVVIFCGGREANTVASWFLGRFDTIGLTFYKFAILTFFLAVCEILGRRNLVAGRRLAATAILINLIPVVLACMLLFRLFFLPA